MASDPADSRKEHTERRPYHPRAYLWWLHTTRPDLAQQLTRSDHLVLWHCLMHVDWKRGVDMRACVGTLARETGRHRTSVARSLKHLGELGLIEETGTLNTRGGLSTVYAVRKPERTPAHGPTGSERTPAQGPTGLQETPAHGARDPGAGCDMTPAHGAPRTCSHEQGPENGSFHDSSEEEEDPGAGCAGVKAVPGWTRPGVRARWCLEDGTVHEGVVVPRDDGELVFQYDGRPLCVCPSLWRQGDAMEPLDEPAEAEAPVS